MKKDGERTRDFGAEAAYVAEDVTGSADLHPELSGILFLHLFSTLDALAAVFGHPMFKSS